MMNFVISLYVIIVITVFGSIMTGSDGGQVQISRIGSHEQIFPQVGPQVGPNKNPGLNFKSAPDEQ